MSMYSVRISEIICDNDRGFYLANTSKYANQRENVGIKIEINDDVSTLEREPAGTIVRANGSRHFFSSRRRVRSEKTSCTMWPNL